MNSGFACYFRYLSAVLTIDWEPARFEAPYTPMDTKNYPGCAGLPVKRESIWRVRWYAPHQSGI